MTRSRLDGKSHLQVHVENELRLARRTGASSDGAVDHVFRHVMAWRYNADPETLRPIRPKHWRRDP